MGLVNALKNQRHKQMEHFGILFILLTVCFIVVCCLCAFYQNADDKARDAEQSLYTSSFTTSRSGVKGDVLGVFTDEAYTHCVILMKLSDMSNMPLNASSYQGYLAVASTDGKSQYALEDAVTGSIYVYGSTGYIAVYLSNPAGFDAKHLYLMMQNLRPMQTSDKNQNQRNANATDKWSVIFNAGATGTYKVKSLASEPFDAQTFYADTLLATREKKLKADTETDLALLRDDISSIVEWRDRCTDSGVDMSKALPPDIKGDNVIQNDNKELELVTEHDAPGAINIDWRNGNVKDGYLPDSVDISSTSALSDYIIKQAQAGQNVKLDDLTSYSWVTDSGEKINLSDDSGNVIRREQISNIKSYIDAVNTYRADKSRYQSTDMLQFVTLELDYNQTGRTMTVNVGTADKPAIIRAQ